MQDFPEYYHYYAEHEFVHGGIKQGNRNPLLYRNIGADGLKTGHTQAAGYCLTASAKQGDRRLILVVTGLGSMQARSDESERLIGYGFREFDNYALFKAGEEVATGDVWLGTADTVPIVAGKRHRGDAATKGATRDEGRRSPTTGRSRHRSSRARRSPPSSSPHPASPPRRSRWSPAQTVERKGFFGRIFAGIGHRLGNLF